MLISRDGHVQICGFVCAKHFTARTATIMRELSEMPWQSPELLQDDARRTFQSDVYAFGITISQVCVHPSELGILYSKSRPDGVPA